MSVLILEVAVCLGFLFLFYQCCFKKSRAQSARALDEQEQRQHRDDTVHEDLRRMREQLSERATVRTRGASDSGARDSSIASREGLIEKNLFCRRIRREESVRELSRLLAISRGGGGGDGGDVVVEVDEELGSCDAPVVEHATAVAADPPSTKNKPDPPADSEAYAASSPPEPSAPPSLVSAPTTDTIATALSSLPEKQQHQQQQPSMMNDNNPTLTLAPIRNLWSSFTTYKNEGSERESTTAAAVAPASTTCTTASNRNNVMFNPHNKLECSICLENYSPGDTIAWAKDGGDPRDPPTVSSPADGINNEANGCDHIFHRGCLMAWLQDHDECPLCRRRVVHFDADVRFAGWEMGQ
mmetsp:Transcript_18521/g.44560  ORF Transcript_18521/g.44560 Transcript_18521/m.44560 type:complete len:356 (-) Transcript_18521:509-1576(-)